MKDILITLITIGIPSLVTLISGKETRKLSKMHSARQSIMQLILEDHVRVQEKRLPENKQNILHEYDEYIKDGGNSYINNKVKEYNAWYEDITNTVYKK